MAMSLKQKQKLKEFFIDNFVSKGTGKRPAWLAELAEKTGRKTISLSQWFAGSLKSEPLEKELVQIAEKIKSGLN